MLQDRDLLKGIVQTKMKIIRVCVCVCVCVLSQVCKNVSQQWMLCSEWVPSERESDKNITIIHSPSVIIWRRQKLECFGLFSFVNAADFSPDSDQNTFTEEELLWIMNSY